MLSDFAEQFEQVGEAVTELEGKMTVPFVGEGTPHPNWVLTQIIGIRNTQANLKVQLIIHSAILEALLDPENSVSTIEDTIKQNVNERVKELHTIAQEKKDKEKKIVTPNNTKNRIIRPSGGSA